MKFTSVKCPLSTEKARVIKTQCFHDGLFFIVQNEKYYLTSEPLKTVDSKDVIYIRHCTAIPIVTRCLRVQLFR